MVLHSRRRKRHASVGESELAREGEGKRFYPVVPSRKKNWTSRYYLDVVAFLSDPTYASLLSSIYEGERTRDICMYITSF